MNQTNSQYLAPKPRYEILDGLRGVAALIVVAFHLFEVYSGGPMGQILNHGYLAVDFFFLLSGFVIGYAYDDRWGKMTVKDFFKRRLIRLQPMVVMGSLLGALLFYFGTGWLIAETPWWKVLLILLLACVMIPAPRAWDIRGWGETNPLNGPNWSLTLEYIANILYALFIRRFPKAVLAVLVACAAVLTLDLTLNLNLFGLLTPERSKAAFTVIGGWSLTPEQVYIGFTRLLYPFFAGLLLFRIHKLVRVRGGFWWCSLLVAAILVMPRIGGADQMWMNGIYDAFCILIMFPLVVSMGAGSDITDAKTISVCKFLGAISYPLYITHYPLVYMQWAWVGNHPDASLGTSICLGVSVYLLAIGVAYACLKLYDEPVREWLKNRFLMR